MAQSKIIIDTNTYLRLAKTVRPLLFVEFGENEYCLYIIPELNQELSNWRLRNKFPWVDEEEYIENRKYFPKLSRKQNKSIQDSFEYIWEYVQTDLPGPSKVDARYIAYALELNIPVITDDQDMTELAIVFEVEVMPTLALLKIMLDCGHIDIESIKVVVEYWRYLGDRPANMDRDYNKYFGEN